jgi:sulfatase maturation enzyme AslB (radical SAM superfamily)
MSEYPERALLPSRKPPSPIGLNLRDPLIQPGKGLPVNFREHALDGAKLLFDRAHGTNILLPGQSAKRQAPRVLQIGLLTPCNLTCSFCYRDQAAPSRLTSEFLLDLLRGAAEWGVLEVAFGGGEPLLFRGFP